MYHWSNKICTSLISQIVLLINALNVLWHQPSQTHVDGVDEATYPGFDKSFGVEYKNYNCDVTNRFLTRLSATHSRLQLAKTQKWIEKNPFFSRRTTRGLVINLSLEEKRRERGPSGGTDSMSKGGGVILFCEPLFRILTIGNKCYFFEKLWIYKFNYFLICNLKTYAVNPLLTQLSRNAVPILRLR